MSNNVQHGAASAVVARLPSPKIWADCPVLQMLADPAKGFHLFEDFKLGDALSDGTCTGLLLVSKTDASDTVNILNDDEGHIGLYFANTSPSENDYFCLATGDNISGMLQMTKGDRKRFWFEIRFKVNTVDTDDIAVFIGLAEEALGGSATGLMDDSTIELVDKDYLGFFINDGDGDDLTIVYNKESATAQSDTGEIAIAADTFLRVGFRRDVADDKIRVYLNGVDQGDDAAIDCGSVNFPSAQNMGLYICLKGAGSVAQYDLLTVDWVRIAKEY